jgi:hypothetical protein
VPTPAGHSRYRSTWRQCTGSARPARSCSSSEVQLDRRPRRRRERGGEARGERDLELCGGGEYSGETTDESNYFKHPGVAITVSSGDGGYGVEFPAASQYVTEVGGTTLALNPNGGYGSETAWNGSGSGCSAYIAKPTWQTDTGCSNRTVADVSADADPNTGAAVYDSVKYQGRAGWFQVGGTSFSAPQVTAVYALAGNAASVDYGSFPYSHTGSVHDTVLGGNGNCGSYLCTAVNGYDGPHRPRQPERHRRLLDKLQHDAAASSTT